MAAPTFDDTALPPDDLPAGQASFGGLGRVTVLPRPGDAAVPALPDDSLPRYESMGVLGEGGLGVVIAARDHDIGRRVAIKKIRPDRRTASAFLRFVQEVRTVGRLDHPNIVPIHDVGRDDDGSYWFVMKFVDGETLEAILARLRAGDRDAHARWTFERRTELFLQILHAVRFAHDRGVIHRDLKPANVMVGRHGEVQIVDWGVARRLDGAEIVGEDEPQEPASSSGTTTRAGQVVGTPAYMSPEQARGEPVDERADTWALSMMFYELLTLTHPLDGLGSVDAVLDALRANRIAEPKRPNPHQPPVPGDLWWYAWDGLSKRYPSVAAMIERLERSNDGEIPIECPVTFQKLLLARLERWIDRNPTLSLVLLVTVPTLAAVGLVTVIRAAIS